jgi:P4 family phage/plasmid primase-like protien
LVVSAAEVRDLPVANIGIVRQFLERTLGEYIHLVCIAPDDKLVLGRWFGDDAETAAKWVIQHNARGLNAYWTVNIVRAHLDKKPEKHDMRGARFVHVDVDPPKDGRAFDRRELLQAMEEMRASFVIDSGGGLQGFWRLEKPEADLPAVEHLNRRLAHQLGGDHCHNIDRLMRIPGTVNFPNFKKRSAGRVPALASVLMEDAGETIMVESLDATLPALPPTQALERAAVSLSGVAALGLDDLGITSVDPLYKLITATDPTRRSEELMHVVGSLVRRGKSDEAIAGLVLNPDLPISGHCYDQPDPMRPVLRAIGLAKSDLAEDPGNGPPEYGSGAKPPANKDGVPPGGGGSVLGAEVSEDAIALAFTETYRDTLRYDHDVGRWFRWDGVYWKRDGTDLAMHYTRQFARELSEAKRALCKASVASGAERFARADRAHAVTNEIWDADPFLLGTPGGTVDLRTGVMAAALPEQYISKQTAITPEHGPPLLWLKFLRDAMGGDEELVTFLQRWCGYSLTGDTREHALWFGFGDGGNGKGVFMNTFTGILGDYAVTAGMETFTASKHDRHSTELAMLRGARLVTASETEEGRAWAESKIKSITGGDPITARFMRQDNFTFIPQFKLMIAGNHAPSLRNVDDAMRRRFNIIPFTTKPAVPDRQLQVKLEAEWGQILAWAIRGCRDWLADGLARPTAVLTATKEYFADQDLFGQWFEERCDLRPGRFDTCAKFYADWAAFAKEHGEEPGSAKSFGASMKRKGFESRTMRHSGISPKCYNDIGLHIREEVNDY